ncbi:MAG: MBL fold metallo-hydrolase [Melioribacteraceae bacterium]|nr:MBL fold metallo-hydrolase [Melioribacteraceae bacterium]
MLLKFWGTRGSIPVPGKNTLKYGGNTPCVQVTLDTGEIILFDAGSGIREFGNELLHNVELKDLSIFISHTHWDHIQGLPFFAPLFYSDYNINLMLSEKEEGELNDIIEGQINSTFFPITSDSLQAKITYKSIVENIPLYFNKAVITPKAVKHSKGTLAYKIRENDKTIVYMTDNEIEFSSDNGVVSLQSVLERNGDLIEFCEGVDYLIHDCMYLYDDYKQNWGHSNHLTLSYFSHLAKVKNLVIFHYDPDYDDYKVDNLLHETQVELAKLNSEVSVLAAYEGLII